MRLLMTAACAALALCAMPGCSKTSGPRRVKLSHITPNTSHWHAGGEKFAGLVGAALPGKYQVNVYPGGSIARSNQRTELQMLQSGAIEMQFVSPIILALYLEPKFDAFSTPWLFPDLESARAACTGELARIARGWLKEKGIVLLGVGINGFRQLTNSRKPIRTPDDMAGIKFRVAGSDLYLATFKALGANALTMNFGDVFTSLQEGVIDGQENPLTIISSSRLYEVQEYLTLWDYSFDPIFLVANEQFWNSLPEADRATMMRCAEEAMAYQWEFARTLEDGILKDLAAQGMNITRPTKEELAAFRRAAEPAYEFLREKIGRELLERFETIVTAGGHDDT